jgi:hypothetical protein
MFKLKIKKVNKENKTIRNNQEGKRERPFNASAS